MKQYVIVSMKSDPEVTGPFNTERAALDYLKRMGLLQDPTQYVCVVQKEKDE